MTALRQAAQQAIDALLLPTMKTQQMLIQRDEAIIALRRALEQPAQEPTDIAALVEGMEVSIDVSTGKHDARHRLFGTVTLAQENRGSKHGLILLVQEPTPNFKVSPVQEPVGSLNITSYFGLGNYDFDYVGQLPDGTYSVYTTPPAAQQQWVGLTDDQIKEIDTPSFTTSLRKLCGIFATEQHTRYIEQSKFIRDFAPFPPQLGQELVFTTRLRRVCDYFYNDHPGQYLEQSEFIRDFAPPAAPVQEPVAIKWDAVHEKLCDVWRHDLSADEGLDEIQDLIATPPAAPQKGGATCKE